MRERRRLLVVGLCAIVGIASSVALVVTKSDGRGPRDAVVHAPPQEAPAAPVVRETAEAAQPALPSAPQTVARPAPPSLADRVAALRDALTWTDDAARIEAIESAIAAKAVDTLPVLEAVRLPADPEAAPTIIHAVAVIGREARRDERRHAADTLGMWLDAERRRDAADARGNVSVLVDALGDLGGPDAAGALAAALDMGALPLHVQTLAAQRLAALGDTDVQPALARYAARVAALPPGAGIDELLRQEALAAAALNDVRP